MRFSKSLIPTLKEDPSDAEVVSHKLMVRAGMIRQVARGIYDFLPLGLRVVRKVEQIVREEMDRIGAQEILMPVVCPAELWRESGRWDRYGKELLRIKDRYERDFCFGPTHEEVVTDIVRREVRSYRELPQTLYQIQVKFRDEARPRFGLMRGREFIMKDAYSFHASREDCEREYRRMYDAYTRVFQRCGVRFRPVEAATGMIGGTLSHEFHALAQSGEDALVSCNRCSYAANVEKAEIRKPVAEGSPTDVLGGAPRKVHTPDQRTVEEVSAFLKIPTDRFVKTLLYVTDAGQTVAALVRGDHELSEAKLLSALGCGTVTMADAETVHKITGAAVGFAGPIGLGVRRIADYAIAALREAVTGANQSDYHLTGVNVARDCAGLEYADLRIARPGDPCARCGNGVYDGYRGIEVGQVFYLGTKYSMGLHATFLDANGEERPIEMGCYGIGITRTAAAAIEQNHDANGIIWPLSLAPFHVHIVLVNPKDDAERATAERLYDELWKAGVEVLLDDREERPGVKFKDADLIGIPYRITVGPKGLARGVVEIRRRRDAVESELPIAAAVNSICAMVREGLGR